MLASGSPRRRELLAQLGLPFTVVPRRRRRDAAAGRAAARRSSAGWPPPRPRPSTATRCWPPTRSSRSTARSSASPSTPTTPGGCCAGCRAGRTRSTPASPCGPGERVDVEVGDDDRHVRAAARRRAIDWYLGTGEPFDKAGAYAIQGAGGVFVEAVRGSVSNVVGLPLTTVARLLATAAAGSRAESEARCALVRATSDLGGANSRTGSPVSTLGRGC